MKITRYIFILSCLVIQLLAQRATAVEMCRYEVKDHNIPLGISLYIFTHSAIEEGSTWYLKFYNRNNDIKRIGFTIQQDPVFPFYYKGQMLFGSRRILEEMVQPNNRSYWDKMRLYNDTGQSVNISNMSIKISYEKHGAYQIGLKKDFTLAAYSQVNIPGNYSRREFVKDYFDWTNSYFLSLHPALRYYFYDLGKSGSSNASDSADPDNPKYGCNNGPEELCSEAVSWYYYDHKVVIFDYQDGTAYDFRDITNHYQMRRQFMWSDRLYCYKDGQWIRRVPWGDDPADNWDDLPNWDPSTIYDPQPGDYFVRVPDGEVTGHSMMMIKWDDANAKADVINGLLPVYLRKVTIKPDRRYCVGEIPAL